MEKEKLYRVTRNMLLAEMAGSGLLLVPAAVSVRHVHLCRNDIDRLFGPGYKLQPDRLSTQSGQVECREKVMLLGPRGVIGKVRVRAPERSRTQIEISCTDAVRLGIRPEVRVPGDLLGTPGLKISGPAGVINLSSGVIVCARHLHISENEAASFGLKAGELVSVRKAGIRPTRFDNVIVRIDNDYSLEVHLDTDEGNAAGIFNGDLLELIKEDKAH
jgi:putative phosphotransacetylase